MSEIVLGAALLTGAVVVAYQARLFRHIPSRYERHQRRKQVRHHWIVEQEEGWLK